MASTTQTWDDLGTPPDLTAISVADDITITGKYATLRRLKYRANKVTGGYTTAKAFTVKVTGPHSVNVVRTA